MYCLWCGKKVSEGSRMCSHCGASLKDQYQQPNNNTVFMSPDGNGRFSANNQRQHTYYDNTQQSRDHGFGGGVTHNPRDTGGILWFILGMFLSPLFGLIVYFLWRNSYPIRSKTVLKGSIIGFFVGLFLMYW